MILVEEEFKLRKGDNYVDYVNKFLRGESIGDTCPEDDIETKTTFYEVKGAKLLHSQGFGHHPRLSKYQLIKENHYKIKEKADNAGKKAKYIFVLKIGDRYIWKSMKWETIDIHLLTEGIPIKEKRDGKELISFRVSSIW